MSEMTYNVLMGTLNPTRSLRLRTYDTRTIFCRTLTSLSHENKVGLSDAQQKFTRVNIESINHINIRLLKYGKTHLRTKVSEKSTKYKIYECVVDSRKRSKKTTSSGLHSSSSSYCHCQPVTVIGWWLEVCTGMGTAGITRNLREIRGNGYRYRGNTAGMELKLAGFPWVWDLLSR